LPSPDPAGLHALAEPERPATPAVGTRLCLRLLETTDVHGNLLPFDYHAGQADAPFGLARTATLIRRARAEVPNSLLFDAGDFLQGTPLTDITVQRGTGRHPVIGAMNTLGYDAVALGNHDFNFGLDWLERALREAAFPVTCANAVALTGADGAAAPLFAPYLLLERQVHDTAGGAHRLRIAVIGLVPPQITTWDRAHLRDRLDSRDMVETARALVPRLRDRGADLIVALAHTGIEDGPAYPEMENAALPLAGVAGIDAVLAGHSHQVFPGACPAAPDGVDARAGTLAGTPAVMAGFRGSHLGVLDLTLERRGGRWHTVGHRAEARPVATATAPPVPPDPGICAAVAPAHAKTLRLIEQPLGHSTGPLHSYLAMVRNDPALQLVTEAKRAALAPCLAEAGLDHLPLLATTAPFRTGGRGGPQFFTDIPPGPLRLRHVSDLYPFPNTLCGVVISGADLREWLERAAICFNRITPGAKDQPLLDPRVPGHAFDVIDGLSYRIDLGRPARYTPAGELIDPGAWRIRDLRHDGTPVEAGARFVVATNSYRAFGGGPYAPIPAAAVVCDDQRAVRDVLAAHIRTTGPIAAAARPGWQFVPMPGTHVTFETGPGLRAYPEEIARLRLQDLGDSAAGFARFRMPL
jgi:2',3'-cyclic-nucleotide 2'-phosphodiesterase/3'-nucleotidase